MAHRDPQRDDAVTRVVALFVLGAVIVAFVLENRERTDVRILVPTVNAPLWIVLLVTAFIGILLGYIGGRGRRR